MIKIEFNEFDQVIVTDEVGNDYARTISASDSTRDQVTALVDVLRNVGERVADIHGIVLTGYDVVLVNTDTGERID